MLDNLTRRWVAPPLNALARVVLKTGLSPNQVTLIGFGIGLGCIPALAMRMYPLAGALLVINRILDGLDGVMARQKGSTAFGGYLDIVCDMLFYGGFVFGFALAQPENALWAAGLLFAFLGTSASFLAYNGLNSNEKDPEGRSFFFLAGLAEGTETILCFGAMLFLPHLFAILAIVYSVICHMTTLSRLILVKKRLQKTTSQTHSQKNS